jgi:periplasmic divalent cation tolerance protein
MYQVVLCTCPDNVIAKKIAQDLMGNKLAACVNISPEITSIYSWQDKIECDNEVQLIIKSKAELFKQLCENINAIHPYDTVEIIALNIQQGDENYLNWIANSVKKI